MRFQSGDTIHIVLHSPREKLLGILDEISPAGIALRGLDLGYFDDWVASIVAQEQHLPMNDYFFPMWRVERVTLDEPSGEIPSMSKQFENRTGRKLSDF